jgi:hypothetical protein
MWRAGEGATHSDGADFRNELPPPENLMRPKKLALNARSRKGVKEREINGL